MPSLHPILLQSARSNKDESATSHFSGTLCKTHLGISDSRFLRFTVLGHVSISCLDLDLFGPQWSSPGPRRCVEGRVLRRQSGLSICKPHAAVKPVWFSESSEVCPMQGLSKEECKSRKWIYCGIDQNSIKTYLNRLANQKD